MGGDGASEDKAAHGLAVFEDAVEDAGCALDGGVDDLARIVGVVVERRGGVQDCVHAFDGLVEGALLL